MNRAAFHVFPAARLIAKARSAVPACAVAWRGATRSAIVLMLTALPLAGHAGLFSDEDARRAAADLRAEVLQQKTADDTRFARIEANIDTLQQNNQKLQDSLDRLEQAIRNLGIPALAGQLDGLGQDLAKLRGTSEVQANELDQAQKHTKEFYLDLDARLRVLEQDHAANKGDAGKSPDAGKSSDAAKPGDGDPNSAQASTDTPDGRAAVSGMTPPVSAAGSPPASKLAGFGAAGPKPATAAETNAYEAAYKQYKSANFGPAIRAFRAFNRTWPNSSYAPNAGFWLGMSHFRMKEYAPAAVALKTVAAQYPASPKAPDALLSLSTVQLELGDTSAAHQTLEDLLNNYPGSDAASKAKVRLGRK